MKKNKTVKIPNVVGKIRLTKLDKTLKGFDRSFKRAFKKTTSSKKYKKKMSKEIRVETKRAKKYLISYIASINDISKKNINKIADGKMSFKKASYLNYDKRVDSRTETFRKRFKTLLLFEVLDNFEDYVSNINGYDVYSKEEMTIIALSDMQYISKYNSNWCDKISVLTELVNNKTISVDNIKLLIPKHEIFLSNYTTSVKTDVPLNLWFLFQIATEICSKKKGKSRYNKDYKYFNGLSYNMNLKKPLINLGKSIKQSGGISDAFRLYLEARPRITTTYYKDINDNKNLYIGILAISYLAFYTSNVISFNNETVEVLEYILLNVINNTHQKNNEGDKKGMKLNTNKRNEEVNPNISNDFYKELSKLYFNT